MKIVFTGGGTGGHFYPIIAVAAEIQRIARERKLLEPSLYYIAPEPFEERTLFEHNITFKASAAGKVRRYFSILNFFDFFKTAWGILSALIIMFRIFPDVVFSKGGFASIPTLVAARIFRIPVVVHESDAVPGRANLWGGKFAAKVGVSYPEAAQYFPSDRTALVGNPIRRDIQIPAREGALEFLGLTPGIPVILVVGGSQGSRNVNDAVLQALPSLVERYQIIHQTGKKNIDEVRGTAQVILEKNQNGSRYRAFDYLNPLAMRMAAGIATLVVSRAGSGAIFEIAAWGIPAVIVPIPEEVSHDQKRNAYAYARSGAAVVIEEKNLSPHVFTAEIDRIMGDEPLRARMAAAAKNFSRPDAATKLAEAIISVALEHETA